MTDEDEWVAGWDALCVSLVRPLTAIDAAQAIAQAHVQEFADRQAAEDWVFGSEEYDRSWFATGEVDGWTFVWETNGWQGVNGENVVRLSDRGDLYSTFWNVNSVMSFVVATHGRVIRQFDPLFHDDASASLDVGPRLDAEEGLDWEDSPRTSGLTLLSQAAGVRPVTPAWLDAPGVHFWAHRF